MLFRSNDTATTEIYTLSLHDALPIGVSVESSLGRGSTFVLDLPSIPKVVDVRAEAHVIELEAG